MIRLIRAIVILLFLVPGVAAFAGNLVTINIYNDLKDPNLWLYLQYANNNQAVNVSPVLPNGKYVQPWLSSGKSLTDPLVFTYSNIDGGKLFFGVMGPQSSAFLSNNAAPPTNSDAFFGFIEFAYLTTDPHVTWDLSNVDQLAMLCGLKCEDPSPPPGTRFTKAGYASLGQTRMLTGLLQACNLKPDYNTNKAYLACGPKLPNNSLAYNKLVSPSIIQLPYQGVMDQYLIALAKSGVTVKLDSDDLQNSGGPPSVQFTGTFHAPKINPAISSQDPVVLTLTGNDSSHTTIYLTDKGLNGETIFRSDSDGGMYIYRNGVPVPDGQNVHLNWLPNPPSYLNYIGQEVSSTVRNLLTAMNIGQIPYTNGAVFDQSNSTTWVPAYTGKYYNFYNKFIVDNSNSYGMPYSDAASSKVQYFSSGNATVELHALDPNDLSTYKYYDGNPLKDPGFLKELRNLTGRQILGGIPQFLSSH